MTIEQTVSAVAEDVLSGSNLVLVRADGSAALRSALVDAYEIRLKMREYKWYYHVLVAHSAVSSGCFESVLRDEIEQAVAIHRGMMPKHFRLPLVFAEQGQYMVGQEAVRAVEVGMDLMLAGKQHTVTTVRYSGAGFITVNESRWQRLWNRTRSRFGVKLWLEFDGLVPEEP